MGRKRHRLAGGLRAAGAGLREEPILARVSSEDDDCHQRMQRRLIWGGRPEGRVRGDYQHNEERERFE